MFCYAWTHVSECKHFFIIICEFRNINWNLNNKCFYLLVISALTYIKEHLETTEHEGTDKAKESSDEEDFFSRPIGRRQQSPAELDGYLACNKDTIELLHSFPAIKKLSLKLNMALPASAACERLFSCAGLLFTAKRSRIDSINLENQLLMKLNKRFRKWSDSEVCQRVEDLPVCSVLRKLSKSLKTAVRIDGGKREKVRAILEGEMVNLLL